MIEMKSYSEEQQEEFKELYEKILDIEKNIEDGLYNDLCSEQTMYGYAGYGETKKRDLNDGDIAGIKNLY